MTLQTWHGSCHCGRVRYEAELDLSEPTTRCNCSICRKSRMWFATALGDGFRVTGGAEALAEYRWTPPGRAEPFLHFHFCRTCGIRTHGWGEHQSFGGRFTAVVLATLDDVPDDVLAAAPIARIDGRHDRFDALPEDIRLL